MSGPGATPTGLRSPTTASLAGLDSFLGSVGAPAVQGLIVSAFHAAAQKQV